MRRNPQEPPESARPATRIAHPVGSGRFRQSIGGGGSIPRPAARTNFRATATPSYNLLTGESLASRSGSRMGSTSAESVKENVTPAGGDGQPMDAQRRIIEELRAEVASLKHRIGVMEGDHERDVLRHTTELEDQKRRAQDDFEKKQAAESEVAQARRQMDRVMEELREFRETAEQEKVGLERRLRTAEERVRGLEEEMEEMGSTGDEKQRRHDKVVLDMETRLASQERLVKELEAEENAREGVLRSTQKVLAEKEEVIGKLEADVLRLKAQTGDVETMAIIKRELSDQVAHIRSLEKANREYITELKHLRQVHKAVEVVEEEKRTLQRRVEAAERLEKELGEAQIQMQRMDEERSSWTSYLKAAGEDPDAELEFLSPEEVARALVQERLNSASLIEKFGGLQAEISVQDATIKALNDEKAAFRTELEKAKSAAAAAGDNKAVFRLDRQRALAVKEVEYLRAQVNSFDAEATFAAAESGDQNPEQAKRITDVESRILSLEKIIDDYKTESATLHKELCTLEEALKSGPAAVAGLKRARDQQADADDSSSSSEQIGELTRKLRACQNELGAVQTKLAVREKDVIALTKQLESAKKTSKVRILALRNNPTAEAEKVKIETLRALEKENKDLLALVSGRSGDVEMMPASQLAATHRAIEAAKQEAASSQKSIRRLKEVWSAKSLEFKEAIFSTLGWTVVFMPNGKMRVESTFYPSATDEHENSIVFDGERGTMKVGGGPRSEFARRIEGAIQFWVRDKGCIPGFLAALTLEFYEERAVRNDGEQ